MKQQNILYIFAAVYAVIGVGYIYAISIDSSSLMNILFGLLMAFTGIVLYTVPRLEAEVDD